MKLVALAGMLVLVGSCTGCEAQQPARAPDLNEALRVYLGVTESGAIEPGGMVKKLELEYGRRASAIQENLDAFLAPFLALTPEALGSARLKELGDIVAAKAAASHQELDPDVCSAIGSYYAYQWK